MSNLPPPQGPSWQPPPPQGQPQAQVSMPPTSKSWWGRTWLQLPVWAWLAVVVVLAAGGIAFAVSSTGDDNDVREAGSDETEPDRTDESDDSEESTPRTDSEETTPSSNPDETVPATDPSSTAATTDTSPTTEETAAPPTEPSTPPSDEVAGSPAGATGSRSSPVPAGEVADIGDGWRLQVLDIVFDGAAEVAAENEFNEPPPPGSTFTLVRVALGYFGLEDPKSPFETTISAVGVDNIALDEECGLVPSELDEFNDLFAGGVTVGNLCFVTTAEDHPALQLYALGGFFSENEIFLDATAAPAGAVPMAGLTGPQEGAEATPRRLAPTPVGTAADLSEGWQAVLTSPARDITDAVLAENEFNEPPPEGFRFVGLDATYTYEGDGAASAFSITMKGVGDSNRAVAKGCGVIAGELDEFVDLFAGGSVSGTICFVVPIDDIPSFVLYGTAGFGDDYAALATS